MKGYILIIFLAITSHTALRGDVYNDYINTYSDMAVDQQLSYGIPASITLAQGLLESAAGRSTLATKGNNHFGIKCHNIWQGDTMIRSDDTPNECFRVYKNAAESFSDHSRFLLKKRYASLFKLDPLDYRGWAQELRKCGYATDPNYASRLIAIIERYALYLFDTEGGRNAEENADFIQATLAASHPVRRNRKLHYVIAAPGDSYSSIAKEFKMDASRLMTYNDVRRDHKIKDWEEVWLEPKHKDAPEGIDYVTIGEDESIHSIAQRYGMLVSSIKALNPKAKDRAGTILRLR